MGLLQGSISFQGGENRKTIAEGFWEPAVRSWERRGGEGLDPTDLDYITKILRKK